jgi:hypothetical protein
MWSQACCVRAWIFLTCAPARDYPDRALRPRWWDLSATKARSVGGRATGDSSFARRTIHHQPAAIARATPSLRYTSGETFSSRLTLPFAARTKTLIIVGETKPNCRSISANFVHALCATLEVKRAFGKGRLEFLVRLAHVFRTADGDIVHRPAFVMTCHLYWSAGINVDATTIGRLRDTAA